VNLLLHGAKVLKLLSYGDCICECTERKRDDKWKDSWEITVADYSKIFKIQNRQSRMFFSQCKINGNNRKLISSLSLILLPALSQPSPSSAHNVTHLNSTAMEINDCEEQEARASVRGVTIETAVATFHYPLPVFIRTLGGERKKKISSLSYRDELKLLMLIAIWARHH
jgi:hypothetical protein